MFTKSNTMKIERKLKNKSLVKTPSITTRHPSKKKKDITSTKKKKKKYKKIKKKKKKKKNKIL